MSTYYIRDGRAPVPRREAVSHTMSAIKAKNTKPEVLVRKFLSSNVVRGYRLHWRKSPGRPDIAFPRRKIAIFVHGCFWHRCPHCKTPLPKSNRWYWTPKLNANVKRDARKVAELRKDKWKVVVVWECQLKKGKVPASLRRLVKHLS